jgi:hypothetical protein
MSAFRGLFWVAFLLIFSAVPSLAAGGTTVAENPEQSTYVPPLPAVVRFAAAQGIPIEGIQVADREDDAHPGDSVVLLVTFVSEGRSQQWLVSLKTEPLTEADRQKKPPTDIVLHTITGQVLRYPGSWSAVGIRIAGPFSGPSNDLYIPEPEDRRARALVRTSFLKLGFDRSCLFILRTRSKFKRPGQPESPGVDPGKVLRWSIKPFSPEKVAEAKRLAGEIGMTPEDDQQIGGVSPALAAFLRVVEKVPGMPEMVMHVLEIPSLWSVLREGRLEAGFVLQSSRVGVIEPGRWNLPFAVYRLPFELKINEKPALECTLAVAAPRRPLLTSAGILGIAASNPDNPEKRLLVRVVATRFTP